MRAVRIICWLLAMAFIAACQTTTKKPILAKDVAKYKVGQTTLAEVIAIYGKPDRQIKKESYTILCHSYIAGYIISEDHILRTEFDENGLLYQKNFDDNLAKTQCGKVIADERGYGRELTCYNDADCDNGLSCRAGQCRQSTSSAMAQCIRGSFGAKECANSGMSCETDTDC